MCMPVEYYVFFFNDTATTEIYTLSLHDALPIFRAVEESPVDLPRRDPLGEERRDRGAGAHAHVDVESRAGEVEPERSEEHTSELQSQFHLVCRLLLEKKKQCSRSWWHIPFVYQL